MYSEEGIVIAYKNITVKPEYAFYRDRLINTALLSQYDQFISVDLKEKKVIGEWDTGHDNKSLIKTFQKKAIYSYSPYEGEL